VEVSFEISAVTALLATVFWVIYRCLISPPPPPPPPVVSPSPVSAFDMHHGKT
jgi:hypothetical protein